MINILEFLKNGFKPGIQKIAQVINRIDMKTYFVLGALVTLMFGTMHSEVGSAMSEKTAVQEKSLQEKSVQEKAQQGQMSKDNTASAETIHQTQNVSRESQQKRVPLSEKDIKMLARAVNGEARGESFEGQVAVAAVILNRVESPNFPESVSGVVFERGAFDAVDDGQIWLEPSRSSVRAAYVAAQGTDNTGGALYYFNPAKSTNKWIWSRPQITKIGDHIFAR